MMQTDEENWRRNLAVLRAREKPTITENARLRRPSPGRKHIAQIIRLREKHSDKVSNSSRRQSEPLSRSNLLQTETYLSHGDISCVNLGLPDNCDEDSNNSRSISASSSKNKTSTTSSRPAIISDSTNQTAQTVNNHVTVLNLVNENCSQDGSSSNGYDSESITHVTPSGSYILDAPNGVPECLNTFSDFYNPSVSAEARFEKYLAEMHRRENEVATKEKMRVKNHAATYFPGKYARQILLATERQGIPKADTTKKREPTMSRSTNNLKPLPMSTFSLQGMGNGSPSPR